MTILFLSLLIYRDPYIFPPASIVLLHCFESLRLIYSSRDAAETFVLTWKRNVLVLQTYFYGYPSQPLSSSPFLSFANLICTLFSPIRIVVVVLVRSRMEGERSWHYTRLQLLQGYLAHDNTDGTIRVPASVFIAFKFYMLLLLFLYRYCSLRVLLPMS